MDAIKINGTNHTFGAPEDWSLEKEGECATLAVKLAVTEGGHSCVESAWRPTKEELAFINAGKPVILRIYGEGMPPVALYVEGT